MLPQTTAASLWTQVEGSGLDSVGAPHLDVDFKTRRMAGKGGRGQRQ